MQGRARGALRLQGGRKTLLGDRNPLARPRPELAAHQGADAATSGRRVAVACARVLVSMTPMPATAPGSVPGPPIPQRHCGQSAPVPAEVVVPGAVSGRPLAAPLTDLCPRSSSSPRAPGTRSAHMRPICGVPAGQGDTESDLGHGSQLLPDVVTGAGRTGRPRAGPARGKASPVPGALELGGTGHVSVQAEDQCVSTCVSACPCVCPCVCPCACLCVRPRASERVALCVCRAGSHCAHRVCFISRTLVLILRLASCVPRKPWKGGPAGQPHPAGPSLAETLAEPCLGALSRSQRPRGPSCNQAQERLVLSRGPWGLRPACTRGEKTQSCDPWMELTTPGSYDQGYSEMGGDEM